MENKIKDIALPNYTCYEIIESYGIKTHHDVIIVDVIEFDRHMDGFKKRFGTHSVLVNNHFNANMVAMANMSGAWSKIAMSKSEAISLPGKLQESANKIESFYLKMKDPKQAHHLGRHIRAYNHECMRFLSYGVMVRRPMVHVISGNTARYMTNAEINNAK